MEEKELTTGEKFLRQRANETEQERAVRIARIMAAPPTVEVLPPSSIVNDLLKVVILLNWH